MDSVTLLCVLHFFQNVTTKQFHVCNRALGETYFFPMFNIQEIYILKKETTHFAETLLPHYIVLGTIKIST
jgi:hypothetical protein